MRLQGERCLHEEFMMKSIKSTLLVLLLLGPMAVGVTQAAPVGHAHFSGGFRGGFHGGHVGVFVDPWPLFYPYGYAYGPYDYYPYAYYPPAVVTQQVAPTVYVQQDTSDPVQQPNTASSPAASNDWYYCRNPQGYYPYVRSCANGWERVPAQPPTQR
jgi:hypothetical protein